MFGLLENLTKAVVGIVVEVPVALVADAVTLGGSITDKHQPYTADALSKVMKSVSDATK